MDWNLRILSMLSGLLVISGVVRLLVKRKLDEAHSFLWLFLALIALVAGFLPDLVSWFAARIGVGYSPTLVLIVSTIIILFVVFQNTIEITTHKTQNHELAMQVSMLNSEVRHLTETCKVLQAEVQSKGVPEKPLR